MVFSWGKDRVFSHEAPHSTYVKIQVVEIGGNIKDYPFK